MMGVEDKVNFGDAAQPPTIDSTPAVELIYVGFWRRLAAYAVDFAILIPYGLLARQLFGMSDQEYAAFTSAQAHVRALEAGAPTWYQPLQIVGAVWIYSEFLVLLTNKKRRALHDFMAGTVVIRSTRHTAT